MRNWMWGTAIVVGGTGAIVVAVVLAVFLWVWLGLPGWLLIAVAFAAMLLFFGHLIGADR